MFVVPPPQSRTNSTGVSRSSKASRVYQAWKGSNKFFICGRLIFGPDVRSLVVTLFLIIVPVVIFCVFVASRLSDKFPHKHGVAIVIVTTVYTSFVLVLLLLTSSRDPGILPRNAHPPEPEEDFDVANSPADWGGSQTPRYRLPRTKDVLVNGVSVKVKYCDTCMLYRPPRCSHCSICNNCVQRFDHHCPWVGQCIGLRNYRYFFMFVSSTTLLCIFVFGICALNIKILMLDHGYTVWRAMGKSPPSVLLMAYTFIAVWFVGGLTFFHLYLISTNQTTYENFRYRYDNKVNPYNRGIFRNFREVLCSPIVKSLNNFRARVQADGSLPPSTNLQQLQQQQQQQQQVAAKPRNSEASKDLEAAKSTAPAWPHPLIDEAAFADLHSRVSNVDIAAVENMTPKDGFEEMFPGAFGRTPVVESAMHPRRSSWGRKSGNWEITPDLLGGTAGSTPAAAAGSTPAEAAAVAAAAAAEAAAAAAAAEAEAAAECSPCDNPGTR